MFYTETKGDDSWNVLGTQLAMEWLAGIICQIRHVVTKTRGFCVFTQFLVLSRQCTKGYMGLFYGD